MKAAKKTGKKPKVEQKRKSKNSEALEASPKKWGEIFVISGASGAGKSTLIRIATESHLARSRRHNISLSVSWTTRKPRDGEVNGVRYNFVSKNAFKAAKKKGFFLECAKVHGEFYGTSFGHIMRKIKQGEDVILDVDVQGFKQIRKFEFDRVLPKIHSIFVLPPGIETLEERLAQRGQANNLNLRLAAAREEMSRLHWYDHYIVTEDQKQSAGALRFVRIVQNARKARTQRK